MLPFYHVIQKAQVCTFTILLVTMEVPLQKTDRWPVEPTPELISGKYKALILWHLSCYKLRFNELRKLIKGASPKMPTQQLGSWKRKT